MSGAEVNGVTPNSQVPLLAFPIIERVPIPPTQEDPNPDQSKDPQVGSYFAAAPPSGGKFMRRKKKLQSAPSNLGVFCADRLHYRTVVHETAGYNTLSRVKNPPCALSTIGTVPMGSGSGAGVTAGAGRVVGGSGNGSGSNGVVGSGLTGGVGEVSGRFVTAMEEKDGKRRMAGVSEAQGMEQKLDDDIRATTDIEIGAFSGGAAGKGVGRHRYSYATGPPVSASTSSSKSGPSGVNKKSNTVQGPSVLLRAAEESLSTSGTVALPALIKRKSRAATGPVAAARVRQMTSFTAASSVTYVRNALPSELVAEVLTDVDAPYYAQAGLLTGGLPGALPAFLRGQEGGSGGGMSSSGHDDHVPGLGGRDLSELEKAEEKLGDSTKDGDGDEEGEEGEDGAASEEEEDDDEPDDYVSSYFDNGEGYDEDDGGDEDGGVF